MTVTTENCAGLVGDVLRSEYADARAVAKRMARKRGFSQRAFCNWFYGVNAPRMADLVVLMAECEALEAAVLGEVRRLRSKP